MGRSGSPERLHVRGRTDEHSDLSDLREACRGAVERLYAVAALAENGLGELEYAGRTDIDWDSQQPVTEGDPPRVILTCREHEWRAEPGFAPRMPGCGP